MTQKSTTLASTEYQQTSNNMPLLDHVLAATRTAGKQTAAMIRDAVLDLVENVVSGCVIDESVEAAIDERIADLDGRLQAQANEIQHHPDFQELEGTWRGIQHVVANTDLDAETQVFAWNVSKDQLTEMFADCQGDIRTTRVFNVICRNTFEVRGGQPWSLVIGGFRFGPDTPDVKLLGDMSLIGSEAHVPFIAGQDPSFFGVDDLAALGPHPNPDELVKLFELPTYAEWYAFRKKPEAVYVGLAMPAYVARLPFDPQANPAPKWATYREQVFGPDASRYLWGNPAFLLGQRVLDSLAQYGWPANITGELAGGLVEDLPLHVFQDGNGGVTVRPPVQMLVDDPLARPLADLGFIPLQWELGAKHGVFDAAPSARLIEPTGDADADADAKVAARLPVVLVTCRFAHNLKVMLRRLIGSKWNGDQIQKFLEAWIGQYTLLNYENATDELKAQRPLKEAVIEVVAVDGQPGNYAVALTLVPHLDVESVTVLMNISAGDPPAGNG